MLLLHVSLAVWIPDLINHRHSSGYRGVATFRRRNTVKNYLFNRHPFDFISRNIDFISKKENTNHDSKEISKPVVQQFLLKLSAASRFNEDSLDRILGNDEELLKSSKQWANLSAKQFQTMIGFLDLGSFRMRNLLLKLLELDIGNRTSSEKLFLLELCSIIIQTQNLSFNRKADSDFLFKLLQWHGDLIADYIPESVWLSLNLTQAEQLLDLEKESVSSHVKSYKSIFVEGMDEKKSRKLKALPWEQDIHFIYEPELNIFSHLKYVGKFSFPMNIELRKSLDSHQFKLTFSFHAKPRLVPEFVMYIETKDGTKRMATQLFFINEEYMNMIRNHILDGGKDVKIVSLIDAIPFVKGQEYVIAIQLVRLVPLREYYSKRSSSNSQHSTAGQNNVLPSTSRPEDFPRSPSKFSKSRFSKDLSYMHLSDTDISMMYR
jgi:hypothetical protein